MVLTGLLTRWAARRPHALLAVAPGATAARLAVERELAALGGSVAVGPADADLLVIVGEPGEGLAGAIDEVWRQLPGPRARIRVADPDEAREALAGAVAHLGDEQQRRDAAERRDEWQPGEVNHEGGDQHDHGDHGGPEAEGHGGHGGPEAEGHGGHGGGGMQMPGGLMMADRAADRDGLKLDALQVSLGPVLPDWPAGLVMDLTLQGDIVQRAEVRLMPAAGTPSVPFWDAPGEQRPPRHAAAHLDSLGRLLAVAGWPAMADRLRRLRDGVLAGGSTEALRAELARAGRRMQRSRTLHWATDGLGVLTDDLARRAELTGPAQRSIAAGGDVTARWRCWLADAERLLQPDAAVGGEGPRGRRTGGRPGSAALLEVAPQLIAGVDVAAARLILASLDPDLGEVPAGQPAGAG